MPIYEYYCSECNMIYKFFIRNISSHKTPLCPKCGTASMQRRMSSFSIPKSDDKRLEKFSDPAILAGLDQNNPKSMARWMKKISSEIGNEELGGEFQEMLDRLEAGEKPEDIEKRMKNSEKIPIDNTLYEG